MWYLFFIIPVLVILGYAYEAAHGDSDAEEELKKIMDDDEADELMDEFRSE